ncbi:hypothetical protein B0H17DRAFT_1093708, partial [Mycena rosella]
MQRGPQATQPSASRRWSCASPTSASSRTPIRDCTHPVRLLWAELNIYLCTGRRIRVEA